MADELGYAALFDQRVPKRRKPVPSMFSLGGSFVQLPEVDITLSGLAVFGAFGQNVLTWAYSDTNNNPSFRITAVEIWMSKSNDRTLASHFGDAATPFTAFNHIVLPQTGPHYYWVRARNVIGNVGPWYPVSPTGGIASTLGRVEDANAQWVNFATEAISSSGTIADEVSVGRYKLVGKTCLFAAWCSIVDNGTGFGRLRFELPFPLSANSVINIFAAINLDSSETCTGYAQASDATCTVVKYDGTYPINGNNEAIMINGSYEVD